MAQQIDLDLRKSVKQYMKLTLTDGKTINVCKPSKKIFNLIRPLAESFTRLENAELSETDSWDLIDTIYDLISKILSHNLEREVVSVDYVEDTLDIEDIKTILELYMQFVNGHLETAKN